MKKYNFFFIKSKLLKIYLALKNLFIFNINNINFFKVIIKKLDFLL